MAFSLKNDLPSVICFVTLYGRCIIIREILRGGILNVLFKKAYHRVDLQVNMLPPFWDSLYPAVHYEG
jgi:hypothetical protein